MKVYEDKEYITRVIVDVICDWCGKSDRVPDSYDWYGEIEIKKMYNEWGDYWIEWGIEVDLCEECALKLKELLKNNGVKVRELR